MKYKLTSVVCCAAALMSFNALADSESSKQAAAQAQASQQDPSLQQANVQEFFRASDLIGKNTQDSKAKEVGSIKDMTFNQQGEIFAFIDVGDGKWAVVPWQAVNAASAKGSGNVTLNATHQQLKAGPAVTKNQWGSLNNPKFVQGAYAYYNIQPPASSAGAASSPGGQSSGASPSLSTPPPTTQDTNATPGGSSDTNSPDSSSGGSSDSEASGSSSSQQ